MMAANGRKPAMIDPSPELPDDMLIADVEFPPKVGEALAMAGLRTVGQVREAPDAKILQIQDLGESSLALLRKALGLPSSLGVRCDAAPKRATGDHPNG
jgi:hypothetical protein